MWKWPVIGPKKRSQKPVEKPKNGSGAQHCAGHKNEYFVAFEVSTHVPDSQVESVGQDNLISRVKVTRPA